MIREQRANAKIALRITSPMPAYGTNRLPYLSFPTVSFGLVADRYIVLALSDLQGLLMLLFVDMLLQRCRRLLQHLP